MTRLKIGLRLGVAFGFVVLLGLLTAALAVARLNATSGDIEQIASSLYPKTALINTMKINAASMACCCATPGSRRMPRPPRCRCRS